jgi:ethanolamine utilization cobalamin adenosyltransferase
MTHHEVSNKIIQPKEAKKAAHLLPIELQTRTVAQLNHEAFAN